MNTKHQGFGLPEIMISLVIASLLLVLLMQYYLTIKRQALFSQSLLEQELEQQLVSDFMRDRIRRAGFTPCLPLGRLETATGIAFKAVETGNSLTIRRMSENFARLLISKKQSQFLIKGPNRYKKADLVLIADCYHAELGELASVRKSSSGTFLQLTRPLHFEYQEPVYLGGWLEEIFYIRKNKQAKPALYFQSGHAEELSSLIQSLSSSQNKTKVRVHLGLGEKRYLDIEAKVRAS